MATFVNTGTLKFQLFDVLKAEELLDPEYFKNHDLEGLEMFLDSITAFSEKELFPYFQEMDKHPSRFEDGKIITHDQLSKMFKEGADLGVIAGPLPVEHGGLQTSLSLHTFALAIMDAANNSMPAYTGLTFGALELILEFGNDALIEKYAEDMINGKYAGTICLTAPHAGSSLSDITTTAYPQ